MILEFGLILSLKSHIGAKETTLADRSLKVPSPHKKGKT